jgi:hypothetical protein
MCLLPVDSSSDSPLPAGPTFTDAADCNGVTVTVSSRASTLVYVTVQCQVLDVTVRLLCRPGLRLSQE